MTISNYKLLPRRGEGIVIDPLGADAPWEVDGHAFGPWLHPLKWLRFARWATVELHVLETALQERWSTASGSPDQKVTVETTWEFTGSFPWAKRWPDSIWTTRPDDTYGAQLHESAAPFGPALWTLDGAFRVPGTLDQQEDTTLEVTGLPGSFDSDTSTEDRHEQCTYSTLTAGVPTGSTTAMTVMRAPALVVPAFTLLGGVALAGAGDNDDLSASAMTAALLLSGGTAAATGGGAADSGVIDLGGGSTYREKWTITREMELVITPA